MENEEISSVVTKWRKISKAVEIKLELSALTEFKAGFNIRQATCESLCVSKVLDIRLRIRMARSTYILRCIHCIIRYNFSRSSGGSSM